jgi:LmbE family N-acetylglucosaminyl deacetylase
MQKIIFGIFAHPDDEAFGPCGTLVKEVQAGTELHLITLTAGENGMNPDNVANLGEVRLREWQASTEQIGATTTHHLGYIDGTLSNNDHIAIANQIEAIVRQTTENRDDISIEFISLDLNGMTGHIDHIVAGRSACLTFYRLKSQGLPVHRIRLACLSHSDYPDVNTDFVYMEPGHTDPEISETIDARDIVENVREVMHCHYSQRSDCETQIAKLGDSIALDRFIVLN